MAIIDPAIGRPVAGYCPPRGHKYGHRFDASAAQVCMDCGAETNALYWPGTYTPLASAQLTPAEWALLGVTPPAPWCEWFSPDGRECELEDGHAGDHRVAP